jgi:antitoxin VapB
MSATNTSPKPEIENAPASQPATKTAKLFKNGRSQAVRLPKEFRFEGTEVTVRRDPETGEVVLSQPRTELTMSFDEWFALYDAIPDDAPEEEYAKLPPSPKNLSMQQLFKIIDRAHFPADFMANRREHAARSSWQDLFAEWDSLASPNDEPLQRSQEPPVERDFF